MYTVPIITFFSAAIFISVFGDFSWKELLGSFPEILPSTASFYMVVISVITLAVGIRYSFKANQSHADSRSFGRSGLIASSLVSLATALIYSFGFVNASIALKYFFAVNALLFLVGAGLLFSLGELSNVTSVSVGNSAKILESIVAAKREINSLDRRKFAIFLGSKEVQAILDPSASRLNRTELVALIKGITSLCELHDIPFGFKRKMESILTDLS